MTKSFVSDVSWSIEDADDDLSNMVVRRDQEITSEFLDELKDHRMASKDRSKDFHRVASIPVAVVEHWLRNGFDIYQADLKDIIKRLHDEDLTAFLATEKRFY